MLFFLACHALAIGRELIPLKHSDAQDVLVQVFDEELTAEVPFRVNRVILSPWGVALCSHRQLTVRVTLTYNRTPHTQTCYDEQNRVEWTGPETLLNTRSHVQIKRLVHIGYATEWSTQGFLSLNLRSLYWGTVEQNLYFYPWRLRAQSVDKHLSEI